MKFWDPSAIIPLLVGEASSPVARAIHESDRDMSVWWGAEVECVSALSRLERDGVPSSEIHTGLERLDAMLPVWNEISPGANMRRTARRLLRTHDLRAADALQLAAAIRASEGDPSLIDFVSQDVRMNRAAQREGFTVVDPRES